MKKIPCLFVREFASTTISDERYVVGGTGAAGFVKGHARTETTVDRITSAVTPGCEWVLGHEGIATRKRDGTACAIIDGKFYKRYDCKRGKTPPVGAIPCQEPDPVTGHWPHWVLVGNGPEDKWFREAMELPFLWTVHTTEPRAMRTWPFQLPPGTYELCGPKIGRNAESLSFLTFFRHGSEIIPGVPRTFGGLREYLMGADMEGIVFHHQDGSMCKIRRSDFGFPWPLA